MSDDTYSQGDFYITGGTLPLAAESYVVRQADAQLLDGLRRGEFCYVLDTRQMGKSSLMVRTARRLKEEGRRVAVLDLTALGQNLSVEQWYAGLLGRTGAQTGQMAEMLSFWKKHHELGPLQRFLEALRQVLLVPPPGAGTAGDLVLFVDEIDAVRSLPFSADEFFAGIRECYNRRPQDPEFARLTFCLLGVAAPTDLVRDTRLSPFNIGRRIEMRDFTPAEAGPLAGGLAGVDESRARRLLRRILFWTGGHPYMTQRLCRGVAEECRADSKTGSAGRRADGALVDRLCRALFLARSAQETDDNLAFVRNRLLHSEADLGTLLDFYLRVRRGRHVPDDAANPLCSLLRLSGIVVPGSPWLTVRNRIYRDVFNPAWVLSTLPGAETRRQQQAYQRGALRTAGIAGGIFVVMALLAASAVQNAQHARALALRAQRQTDLATAKTELANQNAVRADRNAARADRNSALANGNAALAGQLARQRAAALGKAQENADLADRNARQSQRQARLAAAETTKANQNAAATRQQTQRVQQQEAIARAQLSRSYIQQSARLVDAGDDGAALAPLAEALILDRQNPARLAQHRRRFAWALALAPHLDRLWGVNGSLRWATFSPDKTRVAAGGEDGHARVWEAASGKPLPLRMTHAGAVTDGAFSPDGRRLVTCGDDNRARVWDLTAGRLLWTLGPLNPRGEDGLARTDGRLETTRVAWSRDGERLATARGSTTTVWDVRGSQDVPGGGGPFRAAPVVLRYDEGHGESCTGVAFAPDGNSLTVIARNFIAYQLDLPGGRNISKLGSGALGCYVAHSVAYSRDGRRLLVAGKIGGGNEHPGAGVFSVMALGQGPVVLLPHRTQGLYAVFSPDERRIATVGDDGLACVWDAATGAEIARLMHPRPVVRVAFSPDGGRVLTACVDGTARVWDAATGQQACAPLHHAGPLLTAQFGTDGAHVLTAGRDGTVRLWTLPPPAPTPLIRVPSTMDYRLLGGTRLAAASDRLQVYDLATAHLLSSHPCFRAGFWGFHAGLNRALMREATVSVDGTRRFQVWDLRRGQALSPPIRAPQALLSPDGKAVIWDARGTVRLTDSATGRLLLPPLPGTINVPDNSSAPIFTPDNRGFLILDTHRNVRLLDRRTGDALTPPMPHRERVAGWAFSADGRYLITVTVSGDVRVWNSADGTAASASLPYSATSPRAIKVYSAPAFSPDGRYAVSRSEAGGWLWRLDGSRTLRPQPFRVPGADAFVFSPDSATFAALGQRTWLWNVQTLAPIPILVDYSVAVREAIFSRDSRHVLAIFADGKANIWDVATGRPVTTLLPQNGVTAAAFSPEGTMAATFSASGVARVWDPDTGEALTPPLLFPTPLDIPGTLTFAASRLLTFSTLGVNIWPLPTTSEPPACLLARARLLSGQSIDPAIGSVPVDRATLRADWALVGGRRDRP